MKAHRVEMIVAQDGILTLQDLPFNAGDRVEVIILPLTDTPANPLRGSVARYDDPFEPAVPIEDWEVLK